MPNLIPVKPIKKIIRTIVLIRNYLDVEFHYDPKTHCVQFCLNFWYKGKPEYTFFFPTEKILKAECINNYGIAVGHNVDDNSLVVSTASYFDSERIDKSIQQLYSNFIAYAPSPVDNDHDYIRYKHFRSLIISNINQIITENKEH